MKCVICNTGRNCSIFLEESKRHPTYWRCKTCGLVFAYPQRNYDYSRYHQEDFCWTDEQINARIANYELRYRAFKEYLPLPAAKLLDIGAFNGIFLHYMQSIGVDCLGVELNRDAAEYGRRNFNIEIELSSFEGFEAKERYNIITMFNVLEHVVNPHITLSKVRQLSNPGALFICEVPNVFHRVAMASRGRWYHFEDGHNWFFDQHTIRIIMEKHGFCLDKVIYIPKVATLAKVFDGTMGVLGIYRTYRVKRKIQQLKFYSMLKKKAVELDLNDHMLVISHRI